MALAHAVSGEVVDLLPLNGSIGAPDKTFAVFKAGDLEVMRLLLPAGKLMPRHSVAGSATVQCLRGRVELQLPTRSSLLTTGQFAYLGAGVPHSVHALEDSDLLVTLALQSPGNGTGGAP